MEQKRAESAPKQPHQMILQERERLEMTGVSDVDSFDDTAVLVYTSLGELTVRGSGLHIRRLDLESGSLAIEGTVDCLTYAESRQRGGGWRRLFR